MIRQFFVLCAALAIVACGANTSNEVANEEKPADSTPSKREKSVVLRAEAPASENASANRQMLPAKAHYGMPYIYPPVPVENVDRENYLAFDENRIKQVAQHPVSTFSIDVDTASYTNVRRMLMREGRLPPSAAVKVEEFVNYFSYEYEKPEPGGVPFSVSTEVAPAPWNERNKLIRIGLRGYAPPAEGRPAANLVFLIDVSGSMQSPDKLPLVKRSLKMLAKEMTADDRIALVVYAGAAGLVLESTPGDGYRKIVRAIDELQAGGSTNGGAGIRLAYDIATDHFIDGGINRVIIASDGDMNVGTVDIDALKSLIERKRKSGVALTTLGFGTGNYNYALMEQLADVGNGNAAYIDSLMEARKVLVREMNSTLHTIAKDVKIQVEFNPAAVSEYRLIGYENRILNREDFRNDKVDAGEIGAAHTVTALYEITLRGGAAGLVPESRYAANQPAPAARDAHAGELAYLRLRYKAPDASRGQEAEFPIMRADIVNSVDDASADFRFAAAVSGFGQLLKGGKYTGEWDYDDLLELSRSGLGADRHGYRRELVSMIEIAQSIDDEILPQG